MCLHVVRRTVSVEYDNNTYNINYCIVCDNILKINKQEPFMFDTKLVKQLKEKTELIIYKKIGETDSQPISP